MRCGCDSVIMATIGNKTDVVSTLILTLSTLETPKQVLWQTEKLQNTAIYQGLQYLLMSKQSSGTKIHFILEISTCGSQVDSKFLCIYFNIY